LSSVDTDFPSVAAFGPAPSLRSAEIATRTRHFVATVVAPFEEHRYFIFRRTPLVLKGMIRISRERGLSLQYTEPDPSILIADSGGLLLRDKDGHTREVPAGSRDFISLPLNDKTEFQITERDVSEGNELFPAVEVRQQCRNMRAWLLADPRRRKTRSGVKRFVTTWLAKEQNGARVIGGNANAGNRAQHRDNASIDAATRAALSDG